MNKLTDNSLSTEKASLDTKLVYFDFSNDNSEIEGLRFKPSGSRLLEMANFYNNLNVVLGSDHPPTQPADKEYKNLSSLQAIIELLTMVVKPERIYQVNYPVLPGENSTQLTDLLIIIPNTSQRPFSKIEPLLELISFQHQEIFCTLIKYEKIHQVLEKGDFYFSLSCTKKNLVYANDDAEDLPVLDAEKISYLKAQAKLHFYSHFTRAEKFLKAAKSIQDDACNGIFLFMLHQATEIALRGIILAFSGMDKRTHELRILLKYVYRFCPEICEILPNNTDEEQYLLHSFDEAYLKSRYRSEYVPERHLETILLPKVEQIHRIARKSFENTLDRL